MAKKSASAATQAAADNGRRLEQSRGFQALVTVGLLAYGIVHLLVAWIAVQIAWTGEQQEASQQGAFKEMASAPLGDTLLWITAVGLFALTLWQLFEALWGHHERQEGRKRTLSRLGSAGKVVLYAALGSSAVSTAAGSASSGGDTEKTLTAQLMSSAAGRIVVILVGLVVIASGARLAYRGLAKKFTRDLDAAVATGIIRLGQIGYSAKGIALGIIGVLFVVAAVRYDPNAAGGLDTALRTLRSQAYGSVLLTVMALGIACFGLYCCAWSRHARTS